MVGKFSDDTKMSGSRIPVLYCWKYGTGHKYSTPNVELSKSIAAKAGNVARGDIGEPGIVGNLLEPVLAESACDLLSLPAPVLSPEVVRHEFYEVSMDALITLDDAMTYQPNDMIDILQFDANGDQVPMDEITISGAMPMEIKCTSAFADETPPLERGPIQLQMQMMSIGAQFGILVTLHRGIERRITIYPRSDLIQDRIIQMSHEFLRRVDDEDYYPPINIDEAVIPPADEEVETLDIGDHMAERVVQLETAREHKKELEAEIDRLQLEIMVEMGDCTKAKTGPYKIEWPVRHYKAQPEKVTPAKDARSVRLKTLKISPSI